MFSFLKKHVGQMHRNILSAVFHFSFPVEHSCMPYLEPFVMVVKRIQEISTVRPVCAVNFPHISIEAFVLIFFNQYRTFLFLLMARNLCTGLMYICAMCQQSW